MQKVYLIESVPMICEKYIKAMSDSCEIMVCTHVDNAMEEILLFRPDLLVLDMSMPNLDALALVDHAYMLGVRPKVLASTLLFGGSLEERLYRYDMGTVLLRPFTVDFLVKASMDILLDLDDDEHSTLRRIANNLLLMMGFRLDLQGYRYLLEAVVFAAVHMDYKITGELYPYVAKKCGVNYAVVERACRSCLEKAWENRVERVWNLYFPKDRNNRTRRISNGVFIKRMGYAVYESYCYRNHQQAE